MRMSARRFLAVLGLVAILLSACQNSTSGTGGRKLTGGTATFVNGPNYIFPLVSGAYFSGSDVPQFQFLMYRPLYWFGDNGVVKLNSSLSLADPPVYSNGGLTVTLRLKGWKWSDGRLITSRDVEFWMDLLKANKGSWAAYSPKEFPDNVVSMSFPDSMTTVFTLDKAYGNLFFTYNELSQITPIPQHLWDKTSDASPVSEYDRTPAQAVQVYKYLDGQSKSVGTYNTNPLWQVVSGPWKLKSMTTEGAVAMVPNVNYSGPIKPTLAEFDERPYTSETAEFNALQSRALDYGYAPVQDISQTSSLTNYTFSPWMLWQIVYFQENFSKPISGPIFKQLYFRQAMQHLVDQTSYIRYIFKGYAYPDYGPVPIKPSSDFADSFEQRNPYPFDVNAAAALLKNNGWTVNPGGVDTCSNPGTGPGQCGAGVASGARASFKLEYSDSIAITQEMEALKSDFVKAGIEINLTEAAFGTVLSDAFGGGPTADMDNWGGGWIFSPDYYPTGDENFSTGAAGNGGSYSDPNNDANIAATTTNNDVSALYTYEDYLAKNLPVVWLPVPDSPLSMVRTTLHGWNPQDPLGQINPENWYFTAS